MSAPEQSPTCSECGGPLGAYMLTCHYCGVEIPRKEQKRRLRRVMRALGGLYINTQSDVPDGPSVAMLAIGAGATTAAVLGGLGLGFVIWLGAGLAVWALLHFPLMRWRDRAERADRERIFRDALEPLLRAFMKERGVEPSRLLSAARKSKKLKKAPVMRLLERSLGASPPPK